MQWAAVFPGRDIAIGLVMTQWSVGSSRPSRAIYMSVSAADEILRLCISADRCRTVA